MGKEIKIKGKDYSTGDLINGADLEEAGFTDKLKCSSDTHVCLTNLTKELILEVFEDDGIFKITSINDYVPSTKKTNGGNN